MRPPNRWFWACGLAAALAGCPASEPPPTAPVARVSCRDCHGARDQPPGLHSGMDCTVCHLGSVGTASVAAHRGLEREPGALDTLDSTCGQPGCHPAETARLRTSLMVTGRGLIAVDRWAFGERPTPSGEETFADLLSVRRPSPAQDHLRKLCAGCHLGTRKANRDSAIVGAASGCSACHSKARASPDDPHPPLDLAVPDERCLACHARSTRISLSYQGLSEVKDGDRGACDSTELWDGRWACRQPPDAHFAAGLGCIDCHVVSELMGDGRSYAHQEEQAEVRCEHCHDPVRPDERTWGSVEHPPTTILLRHYERTRTATAAVRTTARGVPLWNLRREGGQWRLEAKGRPQEWPVPATSDRLAHSLDGHRKVDCSTCHSGWAPFCTTCHTQHRRERRQWDFGTETVTQGAWVETSEHFEARPPVLAVKAGRYVPAVPAMIATLAPPDLPARPLRYFAAVSPHTVQAEGRACVSCHRDPEALGLGRGTLELSGRRPRFRPEQPVVDGVARDGWTTLLPRSPARGTREDVRSLNADEQRRVLRVGVCLSCHASQSVMYRDFATALKRIRARRVTCPQPPRAWWFKAKSH